MNEKVIEHVDKALDDFDFDSLFELWLCLGEVMAEKWKQKFTIALASWLYETVSPDSAERWYGLRAIATLIIRTSPEELKSAFMQAKS